MNINICEHKVQNVKLGIINLLTVISLFASQFLLLFPELEKISQKQHKWLIY